MFKVDGQIFLAKTASEQPLPVSEIAGGLNGDAWTIVLLTLAPVMPSKLGPNGETPPLKRSPE